MMTLNDIINLLKEKDNIYILTHRFPDGDTLGSAFGLGGALQQLGKKVKILCSDSIPDKFSYLKKAVKEQDFDADFIVSVDVASPELLGGLKEEYENKIDLCIDHHSSNSMKAKNIYIEPDSAAASEIVYLIVKGLTDSITSETADCLYTGICTDTGSFRYTNVTARTHLIAAELIKLGCRNAEICKAMFETRTKERMQLERDVLETMEYYFEGKCLIISLLKETIKNSGADEGDLDGISAIPRTIKGVIAGVTLREQDNNVFKVSLRTADCLNASEIAGNFGGGGHRAAAGCSIKGNINEVKEKILKVIEPYLAEIQ